MRGCPHAWCPLILHVHCLYSSREPSFHSLYIVIFDEQELAEQADDTDRSRMLTQQLEELEERAELLDKQRTKGLSAIRCVYMQEETRQLVIDRQR